MPDKISSNLVRFSININPNLDNNYKQFLLARVEHLLFNYSVAIEKYQKLVDTKIYIHESKFWIEKLNSNL